MVVLLGASWRRTIAGVIQIVLASALAASHFVSHAPYLYPHYILLILVHPLLVRRTLGLTLPPWQIAYISFALFAHPIGGLFGYYMTVWWFDHLTHTLSATLVAAIGYTLVRALEFRGVDVRFLVPTFTFAVVMTGGLIWETVEVYVDWLTVYSYNDTLWDYVFDALGGVLVILLGRWTLDDGARQVAAAFGRRSGPEGTDGQSTTFD